MFYSLCILSVMYCLRQKNLTDDNGETYVGHNHQFILSQDFLFLYIEF